MPNQTEYKLSFCTVFHRDDGISVIEINEGIEVDIEMSQELIELAGEVLGDKPMALLSNRIHSYSLSFEAMSLLAKLPSLIALAIVVYSSQSRLMIETQNYFISTIKKKPVKIFNDMDTALWWLSNMLKEHNNQ